MVNLWADGQKRHTRSSFWVRQHNMFTAIDRRYGKCRGLSEEVHDLNQGGLSQKYLETEVQTVATSFVMRQESAEAIVGAGRRQRQTGGWKRVRRIRKPRGLIPLKGRLTCPLEVIPVDMLNF